MRAFLAAIWRGDDESGFVGCAENSYHVVCGTDVGESCVVDGFVVRGGNADGESAELQSIGGWYVPPRGEPDCQ